MRKIIMTSITAVVVIAVLAGTLMPVLDDATTTHETFENIGRYYVDTSIDDDVTITMDYDITDSVRTWTIDGVELTYNEVDGVEYVSTPTVVGSDNWVFRTDGRSRGINNATGGTSYSLTVTADSIVSGSLTGDAPVFVASTTETDNVMRYGSDSDVYLNGASEIIGCGYTDVTVAEDTTVPVVLTFSGSVDDGVSTVTTYNKTYSGFTVSNIVVNADEVDGYLDLYDFTSVTFDVTYNDGTDDYVTSCTYSVIAVPAEVTAEKSVHFTDGENAILAAIPVIVIVALLLAVVAIVLRSRMD